MPPTTWLIYPLLPHTCCHVAQDAKAVAGVDMVGWGIRGDGAGVERGAEGKDFFMTEPNLLNLNLEVQVKVQDVLDRTPMFEFGFWSECPEPEPNWTVDSLLLVAEHKL